MSTSSLPTSEGASYLHNSINEAPDIKLCELKNKIEKINVEMNKIETLQMRLDQLEIILKALEESSVEMKEVVEVEPKDSENGVKVTDLAQKLQELNENFYILLKSVDDL